MNNLKYEDVSRTFRESCAVLCNMPDAPCLCGITVQDAGYEKYTVSPPHFERLVNGQGTCETNGRLYGGRMPNTGAYLHNAEILDDAEASSVSQDEVEELTNNVVWLPKGLTKQVTDPNFKLAELVFISFAVKRDELVDVYVAKRGRLITALELTYTTKDALHPGLMPAVVLEAKPLGE